jgi:hypothetical protein
MDNIQKTLFGVIGVAGMIAFLTPSVDPLAPTAANANAQMAPPPASPAPPAQPAQSANEVRPEIEVRMGEPTIDGKPVMAIENDWQSNQNSESTQENAQAASQSPYNIPGLVQPAAPLGVPPYTNIPAMPQPAIPSSNYPVGTAMAPT